MQLALKRQGRSVQNSHHHSHWGYIENNNENSVITQEVLSQAKADFEAELKAQGKPEAIWNKIIPGQIERFIADNTLIDQRLTLLGQFFVMDDKKTIAQVLKAKGEELNDELEIIKYVRFELGEGIEKKTEDFAAEVASQIQ